MNRHLRTSLLALSLLGAGGFHAAPSFAADRATSQKQEQDYNSRLSSTAALADALKRESARAGVDNEGVLRDVDAHRKSAAKHVAAGDYAAARAVLDEGYRTLTAALARLENARNAGGMTGMSGGTDAKAASARKRDLVSRDIQSTKALIDALKRQSVEKSADRAAEIDSIGKLAEAASAALAAGNVGEADALIHDAYPRAKAAIAGLQKPSPLKTGSSALDAARAAAAAETDSPRLRATHARRSESVSALLATGERIAKERNLRPAEIAEAQTLLAQAKGRAVDGRYPDAIAALDHAYVLLKKAVADLRGGQELTADKHFASLDEEYRYEQARNDDYQQLIASLLQSRQNEAWSAAAEKARVLRDAADRSAKSQAWEVALRLINDSTHELKGVLKLAGFPIM